MKILRARPTRHFLYLLVRCRCGKRFGHRADRRLIVCYSCGRIADLLTLRRNRSRKATPAPRRANGRAKAGAIAHRAPANGKARAIARAPARRARKGASSSR